MAYYTYLRVVKEREEFLKENIMGYHLSDKK